MHQIYTAYAINYVEMSHAPVAFYTTSNSKKADFYVNTKTIYDIQMSIGNEGEHLLKGQTEIRMRWKHDGSYQNIKYVASDEYLNSFMGNKEKALFSVIRHAIMTSVPNQRVRDALTSWVKTQVIPKGDPDGWATVGWTISDDWKFIQPSLHHAYKPKDFLDKYSDDLSYSTGGFTNHLANGGYFSNDKAEDEAVYRVAEKSKELPGMSAAVVLPCTDECRDIPRTWNLRDAIMHLNDTCRWTREKIADWLDDLHDTGQVNLEFDPWKEETDDDTNAGKD